jgi:hypothetical protein
MFPAVSWAFGDAWHGSDWEEQWSRGRRICVPRHFDRYFALRLPDGQISDSEFLDFVGHTGDRAYLDAAFDDIAKRGLLAELLNRLDQVKTSIPIENADVFLPKLFDVAEGLPDRMGFSGPMPFISAWRIALWYLRVDKDQESRGDRFIRALCKASGLAVPAVLIGLDIDRRNKNEREEEFVLGDAQLEEAKSIWVEKLKNALGQDVKAILANLHFANHLYRWREFAGDAGPRECVMSLVESPELLSKLLRAFVQEGESHTFGDYVTRKRRLFSFEGLLPFIDAPSLLRKVKELPVDIDLHSQSIRDEFIQAATSYLLSREKGTTDKSS